MAATQKSTAKKAPSTRKTTKKAVKSRVNQKAVVKSTKTTKYNLLDKGPKLGFPHIKKEFQQYLAEFLGTAVLTFAITLNLGYGEFILTTPVLAALVLGFFVYTVGGISGSHLNPAVTLGLFFAGKTHYKTAILYILAQITGAMVAFSLYISSNLSLPALEPVNAYPYNMFEALGTAILVFGIMAVVTKKIHEAASGLVIGGALLLGITLAANYSLGILNPAIAISWTLIDMTYVVSPILGGIFGALMYKLLIAD
jgi:glycerol uptake facilitator-like aquaporin